MWTLLTSLFAPFIWLDSFIQKRFDSVCFFLMRRFGTRKSSIRYAVNALIIGAGIGHLAGLMRYELASPVHIFIGGLFIFAMLIYQLLAVKSDQQAESHPGTTHQNNNESLGFLKFIMWFFFIYDPLTFRATPQIFIKANLTNGQHYFTATCSILVYAGFLVQLYLRKTPMNPPAEKARESVLNRQPAPAKP